jgi:hypothetical protein
MDVNFVGYTFKRDVESERSSLVTALENLEVTRAMSPRPQIVYIYFFIL